MRKLNFDQEFSGQLNPVVRNCFKSFNVAKLDWAPSTLNSNTSRARIIFNYILANEIISLDLDAVDDLILHLRVDKKLKNKTLNEYLTLLRLFTATALTKGLIDTDPMVHHPTLKTTKRAKKQSMVSDDLLKVINNEALCPIGRILVELHCRLGTRISEILALAWCDLDEDAKRLHIRRAMVIGQFKKTKTDASERYIDLNDTEFSLFLKLKKLTFKYAYETIDVLDEGYDGYSTETLKFMFINRITSKRYMSVKDYEQVFFKKALIASGISKSSYGTNVGRHTFASTALSSGIPAENVAEQLGHRDTEMLRKHYGSLIKEMSTIKDERETCFELFTKSCPNDIIIDRSKLKVDLPQKAGNYTQYPAVSLSVSYTDEKAKG